MHKAPCSSAVLKKDCRATSTVVHPERVEETSYIVGPVIARDTQAMDYYIGHMAKSSGIEVAPILGSLSPVVKKPVYSAPIPPKRPSLAACSCSRNLPEEMIERIDSVFEILVDMYFEHVHPAFPVLEESYMSLKPRHDMSSIPATFLVNFCAFALFYWNLSPRLATRSRPDQDTAWQTAVSANVADIQKGDLFTVVATVLNVAGRPSKGFINNMTNVSRLVALSYSMGLNHDSQEWKLAESEKRLRWKQWWAVTIHDRWLNFAQGTPPTINRSHYDVPLPTVQVLAGIRVNTVRHLRAAQCYIELCRLTEIIGDLLPMIYHIRSDGDSLVAEQTSRSEAELNRWLESQPDWLNLNDFRSCRMVPGRANLQLSYLSVRMLLQRSSWHGLGQQDNVPQPEWLSKCQAAADDIVRFVNTLQPIDLAGFWLPYNAQHFTSAVTLLLRCGLQTAVPNVRSQSMASARALVDCLRRYRDEYNWDMAETALAESERVLKRVEDVLPYIISTVQQENRASPILSTGQVDGNIWNDSALQYQGSVGQDQLEELFPGIFSSYTADTISFEF